MQAETLENSFLWWAEVIPLSVEQRSRVLFYFFNSAVLIEILWPAVQVNSTIGKCRSCWWICWTNYLWHTMYSLSSEWNWSIFCCCVLAEWKIAIEASCQYGSRRKKNIETAYLLNINLTSAGKLSQAETQTCDANQTSSHEGTLIPQCTASTHFEIQQEEEEF